MHAVSFCDTLRAMRGRIFGDAVVTLIVLGLAGAASAQAKCRGLPPRAKLDIRHPQSTIYDAAGVFYGCDLASGRVTKLLIDGATYDDFGVFSHNLHATVLETSSASNRERLLAIWNLASGHADAVDRFTSSRVLAVVDSPQGQEVTAIVYRASGHNVLDAVSSRGTFHLATEVSHVTVQGRTVSWTSGGGSHSRTV